MPLSIQKMATTKKKKKKKKKKKECLSMYLMQKAGRFKKGNGTKKSIKNGFYIKKK